MCLAFRRKAWEVYLASSKGDPVPPSPLEEVKKEKTPTPSGGGFGVGGFGADGFGTGAFGMSTDDLEFGTDGGGFSFGFDAGRFGEVVEESSSLDLDGGTSAEVGAFPDGGVFESVFSGGGARTGIGEKKKAGRVSGGRANDVSTDGGGLKFKENDARGLGGVSPPPPKGPGVGVRGGKTDKSMWGTMSGNYNLRLLHPHRAVHPLPEPEDELAAEVTNVLVHNPDVKHLSCPCCGGPVWRKGVQDKGLRKVVEGKQLSYVMFFRYETVMFGAR